MNWIVPEGSKDFLMLKLGKELERCEAESSDLFPDLRKDQEIVIASDYSGEHREAAYNVFAFILTNRLSLQAWEAERLAIRSEFLPNGRRMAFKNLSDARRQSALYAFLQAAGKLNGMLFCVAVEKSVPPWAIDESISIFDGIRPSVADKMISISTYGAFLIGGLSSAGQGVRWITDDDEIVSNDNTQKVAGCVISTALQSYCTHGLVGAVLGIASKFDDGRRAEDLCAIPDLAAGSLSELLTTAPSGALNMAGLHVPRHRPLSTKTTMLIGWLSTLKGPLKTLNCLVLL